MGNNLILSLPAYSKNAVKQKVGFIRFY